MLSRRRWLLLLGIGLAVLIAGISAKSFAATKVIVGRQVPRNERIAIGKVPHRDWDDLLKKYVDNKGLVDYASWKDAAPDMRKLDEYLATLSRADLNRAASREARLAFWINAYNAVTVKGILREYPTTSIRNHTAKLFGYNIWQDLLLVVDDQRFSLDDMEHKILRKVDEPRIHFAIVCAALGCPPLRAEAYVADRLDEQLIDNAKRFFSSARNFRHDPSAGAVALSSIMDWFAEDFGRTRSEQLQAISPFLPTVSARNAATQGDLRVTYLDYDWRLNDRRNSTP